MECAIQPASEAARVSLALRRTELRENDSSTLCQRFQQPGGVGCRLGTLRMDFAQRYPRQNSDPRLFPDPIPVALCSFEPVKAEGRAGPAPTPRPHTAPRRHCVRRTADDGSGGWRLGYSFRPGFVAQGGVEGRRFRRWRRARWTRCASVTSLLLVNEGNDVARVPSRTNRCPRIRTIASSAAIASSKLARRLD